MLEIAWHVWPQRAHDSMFGIVGLVGGRSYPANFEGARYLMSHLRLSSWK
jgi:hypothetical protein